MTPTGDINPVTLARLREKHSDVDQRFEADAHLLEAVSAVAYASPSLTRLLLADSHALEVLSNLDHRPAFVGSDDKSLASWKQLELLRIAARDLIGRDPLEAVGANLAALAEDVLRAAVALSPGANDLAVISMGKLGGRELNYASDIDIMFVGSAEEKVARRVMEVARQCFRVDAALRPQGRDGPLVRSMASFEAYWEKWAQPWEFQALLKARPLAGSDVLQREWAEAAEETLWSHSFGTDELRYLRDMKARSETIVEQKGLADREVKRGRGGIRDVEFAVQMLQLVHGGHDASIRSPNTLVALNQLTEGEYITEADAISLADSYRFLRTVEHRLQLVEQEQTHTVPTDRDSRERLARVLGHRDEPDRSALERFDAELRSCQANVRSAHERLYFRPLLEAFAQGVTVTSGRMEERLAAFGFTDANRTRQAVVELTRGLARSSRLMQQLMPLLLDWLSASPDPDEGLLGLRTLIAGFKTPSHIVGIFRDSPEAARRLCMLLGTGRYFSKGFAKHPEVLEDLGDAKAIASETPVIERALRVLEWRTTAESREVALRRFVRSEQLRIAAADVLGLLHDGEAGIRRSALAEAVLQLAVEAAKPAVPIALIGMGRFGGGELSYASDLDVIVVHGGSGNDDQQAAESSAQALLRSIGGAAPADRLYALDYDLRPEGKNGVLARSIDSCSQYYSQWAQTWERQALVRARFVAGDADVAKSFMNTVHSFAWGSPLDASELREVRHLKARMESERMPRGEDRRFNLKLGPGSLSDVEWTVQLLQLQNSVVEPNTLTALRRLEAIGVLRSDDRSTLETSWRFCDRVRNRLFLVSGGPGDSLPVNAERMTHVARSLGLTAVGLSEEYLQVTRRARLVFERLFYGQTQA